MLNYIIRKLLYGILVLFGVVTVVFVLFFFKPGDPARMMGGQHASPEAIQAINKELGLNLPFHQQYLLYLNDLSPISFHNTKNKESYIYLEKGKYDALQLFSVGKNKVMVLKAPYLRRSYQSKKLVSTIIQERLTPTLLLASSSVLLATFLGVLLGVTAAINRGSFLDNFSLSFSVLGMSGPSYFTGLLIATLFGSAWSETMTLPILPFVFLGMGLLAGGLLEPYVSKMRERKSFSVGQTLKRGMQGLIFGITVYLLGISINGLSKGAPIPFLDASIPFPGTGLSSSGSMYEYSLDGETLALHNLILPAIALGIRPLGIVVQLTRSSMLDVLSQDYIRTATAKGLSRYRIIMKHALKNALNPVVTHLSGSFAAMMAGAIFIEYIFTWRGLGWEVFQALQKDDMPVVMGVVLVIAFIFVLINIFVDIIYGYLDPRVRMR